MSAFETPIASPKKDSGSIPHGSSFTLHGSYSAPALGVLKNHLLERCSTKPRQLLKNKPSELNGLNQPELFCLPRKENQI